MYMRRVWRGEGWQKARAGCNAPRPHTHVTRKDTHHAMANVLPRIYPALERSTNRRSCVPFSFPWCSTELQTLRFPPHSYPPSGSLSLMVFCPLPSQRRLLLPPDIESDNSQSRHQIALQGQGRPTAPRTSSPASASSFWTGEERSSPPNDGSKGAFSSERLQACVCSRRRKRRQDDAVSSRRQTRSHSEEHGGLQGLREFFSASYGIDWLR